MGKNKIVYRSKAYEQWTAKADQLFLMHKKGPIQMLEGPFVCLLELYSTKKNRIDCDNACKAPIDYMARLGLIENDKHMQWCFVGWIADPAQAPPYGCRATVMSWDKKEGCQELTALIAKFGQ